MTAKGKSRSATLPSNPKLRTYGFTLLLSLSREDLSDSDLDRLFESGCDDAPIGRTAGVWHAIFDREAPSLAKAILSAISAVEGARVGLTVERIETDDAEVSTGQIAEKLGVSRETVRLWAIGKTGPGGFPAPLAHVSGRTPLYRWADVSIWIQNHRQDLARACGLRDDPDASVLDYLNARLCARRLESQVSEVPALVDRLLKSRKHRSG